MLHGSGKAGTPQSFAATSTLTVPVTFEARGPFAGKVPAAPGGEIGGASLDDLHPGVVDVLTPAGGEVVLRLLKYSAGHHSIPGKRPLRDPVEQHSFAGGERSDADGKRRRSRDRGRGHNVLPVDPAPPLPLSAHGDIPDQVDPHPDIIGTGRGRGSLPAPPGGRAPAAPAHRGSRPSGDRVESGAAPAGEHDALHAPAPSRSRRYEPRCTRSHQARFSRYH